MEREESQSDGTQAEKMKYLALILLFSGCSMMYVDYAIIEEQDIQSIRDESLNIRAVQQQTAGRSSDLGRGLLFSSFSGIGMGFYEVNLFYGPRGWPKSNGPVYDYMRSWDDGDAWLKVGSWQKLSRAMWTYSVMPARTAWLKYFGGNRLLAMLADWVVSNTVASMIRSCGKYGELRLDIGIDLPFLK